MACWNIPVVRVDLKKGRCQRGKMRHPLVTIEVSQQCTHIAWSLTLDPSGANNILYKHPIDPNACETIKMYDRLIAIEHVDRLPSLAFKSIWNCSATWTLISSDTPRLQKSRRAQDAMKRWPLSDTCPLFVASCSRMASCSVPNSRQFT